MGLGLFGARRPFRRADWLAGVVTLLDVLEEQLVYSAAPLAVLCEQLAVGNHTAGLPLVQEVAAGLRTGRLFEQALRQAVERQAAGGLLLPPERETLCLFAASVGRSGLEQQRACIRRCRDGLEKAHKSALSVAATQAPIWRMAGFAGGVSLALLLL